MYLRTTPLLAPVSTVGKPRLVVVAVQGAPLNLTILEVPHAPKRTKMESKKKTYLWLSMRQGIRTDTFSDRTTDYSYHSGIAYTNS